MIDFAASLLVVAIDFVVRYWASVLIIAVAMMLRRRPPPLVTPRRAVAYAIVFVLALAASLLTIRFRGQPQPPRWFEDDYGYLLTADTYVHGRVANPPHPMRSHFEAMYILQQPKYVSMYLPGNPLVLAFGRVAFGRAVYGAAVFTALAAMALLFALRGWVAHEAAFALACIAAVHPVMTDWGDSFHSGSVSVAGGALIAGAVARKRHALLFGLGCLALLFTRPYEGFVVALLFTMIAIVRGGIRVRDAVVATVIVAIGLGLFAANNAATTGDPLTTPYGKYNSRYLSAPNFIWQRAGTMPRYDVPEFVRIYRQFRGYYERSRSGFAETALAETTALLKTALPYSLPTLWIAALLPLLFLRDRAIAIALVITLLSLLQITWWTQPHYAAPSAALFAIAWALGITRMPPWLGRASLATLAVLALAGTFTAWHAPYATQSRKTIDDAVAQHPGPHLVLVPRDCTALVYNGAEIDRQRVVWARDTGNDDDVLRYYADRTVWTLDASCSRATLTRAPLRAARETEWERDPFVP
jgi:hypothetical protein